MRFLSLSVVAALVRSLRGFGKYIFLMGDTPNLAVKSAPRCAVSRVRTSHLVQKSGGAVDIDAMAFGHLPQVGMKRIVPDAARQLGELAHHPRLAAIEESETFDRIGNRHRLAAKGAAPARRSRSEEHTSELKSLMRISYA